MSVPSVPVAAAATASTDTGIDELTRLVVRGGVMVLTGAGLSTESGIPDYRGPDGTRRVTPMQYAEFIGSSEARRRYWARSYIGWQRFNRAAPNSGHRAVSTLQRAGLLDAVVTQNVDGLHQAAGAVDVTELHGNLDRVVCLTCGNHVERGSLHERLAEANPGFVDLVLGVAPDGSRVTSQIRPDGDIVLDDAVTARFHLPVCLVCGSDTLKPDVVFFGESVPKDTVGRCFDIVDGAHSLLVLGSSLAVMSGYRFVRRAARNGIPVAIVTASASRGDPEATLRLHTPLGATLEQLCRGLDLV
ncbi:MAG TPA: Sir2 family NAD-dependent protein deacetylase [Lapillicoccus sp.]|uniref:Sir2 family NAD-dependent protein deacetylase n=1 Tax=Lapillicoccus sp. TaxID=1909287 RepID=UPI002F945094